MISVEQAQEIILKSIIPIKQTETIRFNLSLGRVSASDIKSKENIPPFNNSAMDGFAVKAVDTISASKGNPKILKVIEDLPAGYTAKKSIKSGQAIRIMTGAPLPKGADAVVMVEETQGVDKVSVFREIKPGENVRHSGEDVKRGEIVIKKGAILKSGHIGMLASLGLINIKVYRRPKIAILATGDELIDVGANNHSPLPPGKIRNSNTYSLYAQVLKIGAVPILLGIAKDTKKDIEKKIRKGLKADMLLVSGGVSVGDYDFVKDVLSDLGMEMKFWKVAMRPGKPLAFGMLVTQRPTLRKVPVFGLPGNPVSSMIAFEQFARPAILKMSGARDLFRFYLPAVIKERVEKKKGLRYFMRAVLENQNGTLNAYLTGPQGSGILKSMVMANGIMELPEDVEEVQPGSRVQVTYLD